MIKKEEVEKAAQAVEANAGKPLPGLRKSLNDMIDGNIGKIHTPEQILIRSREKLR